jgi:hypothetical protein
VFLLSHGVGVGQDVRILVMKHFSLFSFCRRALSETHCLSLVIGGLFFGAASSHGQTRVFLEDFEDIFPDTNWRVPMR